MAKGKIIMKAKAEHEESSTDNWFELWWVVIQMIHCRLVLSRQQKEKQTMHYIIRITETLSVLSCRYIRNPATSRYVLSL